MKTQHGFSLFELVVVAVVIGILASVGLEYYSQAIEESHRVGVEAQASNFTTAVAGVHTQWLLDSVKSRVSRVEIDGLQFYVSKRGWPAHVNVRGTKKKGKKSGKNWESSQNCYDLWISLLQNPTPATVEGNDQWGKYDYHISAVGGEFCRYELTVKPKGSHFFDYVLGTGQVFVTVPPRE